MSRAVTEPRQLQLIRPDTCECGATEPERCAFRLAMERRPTDGWPKEPRQPSCLDRPEDRPLPTDL